MTKRRSAAPDEVPTPDAARPMTMLRSAAPRAAWAPVAARAITWASTAAPLDVAAPVAVSPMVCRSTAAPLDACAPEAVSCHVCGLCAARSAWSYLQIGRLKKRRPGPAETFAIYLSSPREDGPGRRPLPYNTQNQTRPREVCRPPR